MVPYNTLFQPNATFSFFERTFHRDGNGGWERWEFEIDGEQFLFDGDVRYLPEEKQVQGLARHRLYDYLAAFLSSTVCSVR